MKGNVDVTIGLFGTCDNVPWRDRFMEAYKEKGISYFNPMIDNWQEMMDLHRAGKGPNPAEVETQHLRNDEVILFPVLQDSLGMGSLAELGFSVSTVVRNILNGKNQLMCFLIDDTCTDERKNAEQRKDSNRTRALVKNKLIKFISYPNIVLVNSLEEMFTTSFDLYEIAKLAKSYEDKFFQQKIA